MKMTIKNRVPSATNKIRSEPGRDFPGLRPNLGALMLGMTITLKGNAPRSGAASELVTPVISDK
jgi:hypothetical protein